jgi:mono/diheme cytochrome c family protein
MANAESTAQAARTPEQIIGAPFDLADPARIAAGKSRFGANCAAYCHGFEGNGGKTPAFRGRTDAKPNELFKVITEGRTGADVMPAWGNGFSAEKRWELVAYLMSLSDESIRPVLAKEAPSSDVKTALAPLLDDSKVKAPFDLADEQHIVAGKNRFGALCAAYCHGNEGDGGRTPSFKGRKDLTPAKLFEVITEGRKGIMEVMPAWGNCLSEEKRWELVAYIMNLTRKPLPE